MSFTLWTIACGMIPLPKRLLKQHRSGPCWVSKGVWKIVYRANAEEVLRADELKGLLRGGEHKKPGSSKLPETGPDASCNPWTAWALGLHSCRALSSQPWKQFVIDQNR